MSEINLILCSANCIDDLTNYFPDSIINSGLNLHHTFLKFENRFSNYIKFPKKINLIKGKILLCFISRLVVYWKVIHLFSLLNLGFTNR